MTESGTTPLGVRKGAWTEDEDLLLRKCIEKNGEGRWPQVPRMAGLNRCRKSCRLRWLNYLRPNIKRGDFTSDEVDLIVKLHKLLGNRWSLIAGRLPERTANDVKNYWKTHLQNKLAAGSNKLEAMTKTQKIITKDNILRPRPRTLTKKPALLIENISNFIPSGESSMISPTTTSSSDLGIDHHGMPWWDNMALTNSIPETVVIEEGQMDAALLTPFMENQFTCFQSVTRLLGTSEELAGDHLQSTSVEESQHVSGDFSIDVDLWDLLGDQGIDTSHLMG